jgi:GDP-L-fucose synthase
MVDSPDFPIASPVYVAGHNGLVGSAIWRTLDQAGGVDLVGRASAELDLRDRDDVFDFVAGERPSTVVIAAAKVGGILANATYPVEFLSDNIRIQVNLLDACHAAGVERVLFLGSSCIYPRLAAQPIREDSLMTGPLEPTNDAYAIAKIAGVMHIQAYRREYNRHWISAMPTNLYGPGDNFDLNSSHVLPAMLAKFRTARDSGSTVTLWGSGNPRREFLHVDDLARAIITILETYDDAAPINVGTGIDVSIRELAEIVASVTGYHGEVAWDESKPDGTPRKLLDVTRLRSLGWNPTIELTEGIRSTYNWWLGSDARSH